MTETIHDPTVDAERGALTLAQEADLLVITNDVEMESVGAFLRTRVKALLKLIDETFDPIVNAAHKAHKVAVEKKNAAKAPALAAEVKLKRLLADYSAKRQREIDAENRRLEAEARQRAEDERLAQATALAEAGHALAADAVLDAPIIVAPPPMVAPRTAPKGVSVSKVFRFRVTAPNLVKPDYLCPNEQAIAYAVKVHGPAAEGMVGGITVYEESIVRSSAG